MIQIDREMPKSCTECLAYTGMLRDENDETYWGCYLVEDSENSPYEYMPLDGAINKQRFVLCPLHEVEGWISVRDKLPVIAVGHPKYRGYLVYANGHIHVADYTIEKRYKKHPWFFVNGEYEPNVTHYMPLPEPPKEG